GDNFSSIPSPLISNVCSFLPAFLIKNVVLPDFAVAGMLKWNSVMLTVIFCAAASANAFATFFGALATVFAVSAAVSLAFSAGPSCATAADIAIERMIGRIIFMVQMNRA